VKSNSLFSMQTHLTWFQQILQIFYLPENFLS